MFTTMVAKRPTYDFWRYEGTEVIPGKVAKRLNDMGYSFNITTKQLNYDDTSTRVERVLHISANSSNKSSFYLEDGSYLVFSGTYSFPELKVVRDISGYEPA